MFLWPGFIIYVCKVMTNGSMVFTSDRLKNSLKTNSSPRKLEFMDLPHGIPFFQGRPGILHPSLCMDIKWNSPMFSWVTIHIHSFYDT